MQIDLEKINRLPPDVRDRFKKILVKYKEEDRKEEENKLEVQYIFSILAQLKDPRIKEVFNLRYFKTDKKKMPWSEIGRKMSVSTQTAINLHHRGLEILNKKMKSKNPDMI